MATMIESPLSRLSDDPYLLVGLTPYATGPGG